MSHEEQSIGPGDVYINGVKVGFAEDLVISVEDVNVKTVGSTYRIVGNKLFRGNVLVGRVQMVIHDSIVILDEMSPYPPVPEASGIIQAIKKGDSYHARQKRQRNSPIFNKRR